MRPRFSQVVTIVVLLSLLALIPPPVQSEGDCGSWDAALGADDRRLALKVISATSGADCHGGVLFSSGTGVLGFGGYTLQLETAGTENADWTWTPRLRADNSPAFLLPSLPLEAHSVPLDHALNGAIHITGRMTLDSFAVDTSWFLLKSALDLGPGSCVVPSEEVAVLSIRLSGIVGTAAGLAARHDTRGATAELRQVGDAFFRAAIDGLKDAGLACAVEFLATHILGQAAIIAKIVLNFALVYPVMLYDALKYGDHAVNATLSYLSTHPAEALIAYIGNDGNVWLVQPDGQGARRVTTDGGSGFDARYNAPSWSPDGTTLVFDRGRKQGSDTIYLFRNGKVSALPTVHGCHSPVFTRDGRRLLFTCLAPPYGQDAALRADPAYAAIGTSALDGSGWRTLIPYVAGEQNEVTGIGYADFPSVAYLNVSPRDGSLLIIRVVYAARWLMLADADGTHRRPLGGTIDVQMFNGRNAAFTTDGAKIVSARCSGPGCGAPGDAQLDSMEIVLLDLQGSVGKPILSLPVDRVVGALDVSPQGDRVVFDAGNYQDSILYVASLAGGRPTEIAQGYEPAWQPSPVRIS